MSKILGLDYHALEVRLQQQFQEMLGLGPRNEPTTAVKPDETSKRLDGSADLLPLDQLVKDPTGIAQLVNTLLRHNDAATVDTTLKNLTGKDWATLLKEGHPVDPKVRQQLKTLAFGYNYGKNNMSTPAVVPEAPDQSSGTNQAPEPPLTLTITSIHSKVSHASVLRIPSDLKKFDAKRLKTASFLIDDLRNEAKTGYDPQTKALIGAIKRATGRSLPLHRPIQVSGYLENENKMIPAFVLAPSSRKDTAAVAVPATMIVDAANLLSFNPLILTTKAMPEFIPDRTLLLIGFTYAGKSYVRKYRVESNMPERTTPNLTFYKLVPEIENQQEPDEGIDLSEELGENLEDPTADPRLFQNTAEQLNLRLNEE